MRLRLAPTLLSVFLLGGGTAAANPEGEVTISLSGWQAIADEIARLSREAPPPRAFAILERSLDARFDRGVLSGALDVSIESFDRTVEVPLVHADASLAEVSIDGARAVAVKSGRYYVVLTERPGKHHIRVRFAIGREQSRFSRSFVLPLPPAPVTRLALELPEQGLDVAIEGGVVLAQRTIERGTRIEGALDSREALSVRWQRRLTHKGDQTREMEAESLALASISEELVRMRSELRFRLLSGETDRVELRIPDRVEVTGVTGEAILQWYTEAARGEKKLIVLLKHLVEDEVTLVATAEMPRTEDAGAKLAFLAPLGAPLREGWIAVEGRDGYEVKVAHVEGAEEAGTREVPARLSALSDKPLLFAYRHQGTFPALELALARNAQIELTQALIDDLQVSSVLVEQGVEITKMRLFVRNNTRQYLTMKLPQGAQITHALIDGVPFHPAGRVGAPQGSEELLIPLRQSEKLSDNQPRHHVVKPGETLGEVSLLYFNRTDRWNDILAANPGLYGPEGLSVGQRLVIPARAGGVVFEESSFVLELAYKVPAPPLSLVGRHQVALPEMDLPVMQVTWHYYFPDAYEPLSFETNLKQLTAIRYDPVRRFLHFLEDVQHIRGAWAGGDFGSGTAYSNILASRKAIYQREQKREVTEALSAFPLVGERYRFSRVLLGDRQASIDFVYTKRSLIPFVQWGALLVLFVLGLRALRSVLGGGIESALLREPVWTLVFGCAVLLLAGHYVLGVHRHMLLGADLALLAILVPRLWRLRRLREALEVRDRERPLVFERLWAAGTLIRIALACVAIALVLTYPLLLSTFVLVVLLAATFLGKEVRHA